MGKVFTSQTKFNPNPGKYSFDMWNRAIEANEPHSYRIIGHLAQGNFYRFMNVLLDFEYIKEINLYGPKKERKFGARRL